MNPQSGEGIGFLEVLAAIRSRIWVVALSILVAAGAALGISLVQTKQYTASVSLLIRPDRISDQLFGGQPIFDVVDPQRELETNLRLLELDVVADLTVERIGGGITAEQVSDKIEIEATEDSDLISIDATDDHPIRAAAIANEFATAFKAFRRRADRRQIRQAQVRIEEQLATGNVTGDRAERLGQRSDEFGALAELQTGGVELIERVEPPTSHSSPKTTQNVVVGGVAGLLAGLTLALILAQADRRILRLEEVQEAFGLPLIGSIPRSKSISGGRPPYEGERQVIESFRMLRANLRYFDVSREIRSVLVTSAGPEDGKSTVAVGLAAAAAQSGSRVLLMEADLHRPSLAAMLNIRRAGGLTVLLRDHHLELHSAIRTVEVGDASGNGSPPTIDFLFAGPHAPNPAELIESSRMAELLARAELDYDLVVIDTPPAGVLADSIPLFEQVSGVVLVGRERVTTRDMAARLKSHLEQVHAPLLGVVANATEAGRGYAGAEYYDYARPEQQAHSQPA